MSFAVGSHHVFSGVGVVKVEKAPPEAEQLFEKLASAPKSFSDAKESKRSLHYLGVEPSPADLLPDRSAELAAVAGSSNDR